jgi:hypothetical protein
MNRHTVPLERRRLVRELYGDQDASPAPAAGPEPVPEPEPRKTRCDDCGYLVTAPGHQIICGDTP